jgi:hypothetical protein
VIDAVTAGVSYVTRRVDIYESDGQSLFYASAPLLDGNVGVSATSTESRRTLSLTLYDEGGALKRHPGGLWYDKIIKPYRGVRYLSDGVWKEVEWQLGEFMIDSIATANFPPTIAINGRDYSKRLVLDKFGESTTFGAYSDLLDVIKAVALNGGITRFDFADVPSHEVRRDFAFEPDDNRWKAITDMATAIGCDLYFDQSGVLVCRPFGDPADPIASPSSFTFSTGPNGTLASYKKSVGDGRLYNDVVVTGEGVTPPVVGRATVTNPDSPVNIEKIGRRTYRYNSSFISTQDQANITALSFLRTVALEEYTVEMESITLPWIEAGDIVDFDDPDPDEGQEMRFLLTEFNIGFKLGSSNLTSKRVLAVG